MQRRRQLSSALLLKSGIISIIMRNSALKQQLLEEKTIDINVYCVVKYLIMQNGVFVPCFLNWTVENGYSEQNKVENKRRRVL